MTGFEINQDNGLFEEALTSRKAAAAVYAPWTIWVCALLVGRDVFRQMSIPEHWIASQYTQVSPLAIP
ncbi:unnamed protein product [Mesocestoides corti]|uniref:Transmembrane protein n=1 Tax=Mesocestoides corti TaxID=53468 RepID=A0A0R3UPW3_MESCO|nr:unnamed protein product [Mesocestoides corti]